MSSNMLVKKYSLVASLGFLSDLVLCMNGLLFAMVNRLSRNSIPELILRVCFLLEGQDIVNSCRHQYCRNMPATFTNLFVPNRHIASFAGTMVTNITARATNNRANGGNYDD